MTEMTPPEPGLEPQPVPPPDPVPDPEPLQEETAPMADDIRTAEMETELRHIREQARLGEPVDDTRAAVLDAELARIRQDAVAAGKVLLRVLPPHIAFTVAGHTVGTEPTPVPARLVTSMTEAASAAGVTLAEG